MWRGVFIMQRARSFFEKMIYAIILMNVLSFSINNLSFANDDDLQTEEINNLVEDVEANIKEIPTINSRHAVIYDRNSRRSTIW